MSGLKDMAAGTLSNLIYASAMQTGTFSEKEVSAMVIKKKYPISHIGGRGKGVYTRYFMVCVFPIYGWLSNHCHLDQWLC